MSKNEMRYIHPEQLEIILSEAQIDYEIALQEKAQAKQLLDQAISVMQTKRDKANIMKMKGLYSKMIADCDNKNKRITKLSNQLRVSLNMHISDDELFSSLEGTKADSMIVGYQQMQDKKKGFLSNAIAVDKIVESAKEILLMEKTFAKKTKKKEREAQRLLELVNMSPEQRLAKAKADSARTIKKTLGGIGVIGAVGSFFFPPALAITLPVAISSLLGYGTVKYGTKNKHIKKLVNGTKQDVRLLKKSIQDFAYPQQQQIGMGHGQSAHGQQPYGEQDIYGDMR